MIPFFVITYSVRYLWEGIKYTKEYLFPTPSLLKRGRVLRHVISKEDASTLCKFIEKYDDIKGVLNNFSVDRSKNPFHIVNIQGILIMQSVFDNPEIKDIILEKILPKFYDTIEEYFEKLPNVLYMEACLMQTRIMKPNEMSSIGWHQRASDYEMTIMLNDSNEWEGGDLILKEDDTEIQIPYVFCGGILFDSRTYSSMTTSSIPIKNKAVRYTLSIYLSFRDPRFVTN